MEKETSLSPNKVAEEVMGRPLKLAKSDAWKETSLSEKIVYIEERKAHFVRDKLVRKTVLRSMGRLCTCNLQPVKCLQCKIFEEEFGDKLT